MLKSIAYDAGIFKDPNIVKMTSDLEIRVSTWLPQLFSREKSILLWDDLCNKFGDERR